MYKDEINSSSLAELLSPFNYLIVDTCSLMDPNFPEWMDVLANAKEYRDPNQPIFVFYKCYEELKKHAKDKEDLVKRIAAKRALKILRHAKRSKLLTVTKKDKTQNFADNAIYVQASHDRLNCRIGVITQDKNLASDLLVLNDSMSQKGYKIHIFRIGKNGVLERNFGNIEDRRIKRSAKIKTLLKQEAKRENSGYAPEKEGRPTGLDPAEVYKTDELISAHIADSKYPQDVLVKECREQLKAISKFDYSEVQRLSLKVEVSELNRIIREFRSLEKTNKKPAQKPTENVAKPEPVVEKKTPQVEKKPISQPEQKKPILEKKKEEPKPANPYSWYGFGHSVKDALLDVAGHYGIVFRDDTIPYFALAHGPLDIKQSELDLMVADFIPALSNNDRAEHRGNGYAFAVENAFKGYRAYVSIGSAPLASSKKDEKPAKETKIAETQKPAAKAEVPSPTPVPAPKDEAPAAKLEEAPKPKKRGRKPKSAEAKPEQPEPKPVSKDKVTELKVEDSAVIPVGASLVVGEPAKKTRSKPATKKDQKPAAQSAEKKKATPKAAAKKAKTADKAKEAKPDEKKPEASAKAKKPVDYAAKANAADARLKANISNPNYPDEKKKKDIQSQLTLLKKLTPEQASGLSYKEEELRRLLKDFSK